VNVSHNQRQMVGLTLTSAGKLELPIGHASFVHD